MSKLWQKAQETAADARFLFQARRYNSACNRAYYAMFTAARVLLKQKGVAAADAKRHATVWRQFSLHFVTNGLFEMPEALALPRLGEIRNVADYSEIQVTASVSESVIDTMEKFMTAAERVMQRERREP